MSQKKAKELSNYSNDIIHFTGGINDWVGEPGMGFNGPHKMGSGWYRINKPCMYLQDTQNRKHLIIPIQGADRLYKRYVDIYCPADSLQEIKVLDPKGAMYECYMKERDHEPSSIIQAPGTKIRSVH